MATAVTTSSSSAADGSGSDATLPGHIRVGDVERNSTGDSCSFYRLAPSESCRRARSCSDCLNTPIAGAQECVLTPQGFCRTMSWYDPLADFRRNATGATAYHNYFPSVNASYCAASDAACARCRLIANDATASVNATPEVARQFCLGADGCVCLVACEYARWNETVPENCPSDPFAPQEAVSAQVDSYRAYFPIFMGLQMFVLAMLLYRRHAFARLRNRNRAVAEGPYNNVHAISSPSNRLRLSGWRAGREAQMNREKNPRMYLHLDTPAHMQFTEELQPREDQPQSQSQQLSASDAGTAGAASDAPRAADPQRLEATSEASRASAAPGRSSTVATTSAPAHPERESASDLDLKELDTLLQLKH